jgi:hypothetical protein
MSQTNVRNLHSSRTPATNQHEDVPAPRPHAHENQEKQWNMISLPPTISLADRKYELTRMKAQIEADLEQIDAELKGQLHEGDVVPTHHGVGYRLSIANHEVYDQRVIGELSRMRLLPKFVRVSTTKLKELVAEGRLSKQKFEALRGFATPTEIVTLREVLLNHQAG